MSVETIAAAITENRRVVLVAILLLTAGFGAGATTLEEDTAMDEFRTESDERETLEYIDENFATRGGETTTAHVVVEADEDSGNVLERESLVSVLEFQRALHEDDRVSRTLVDDDPIGSVPSAIATTAIHEDRARELESRAAELNATEAKLAGALERLEADPDAAIEAEFETVDERTPVELTDDHADTFETAARRLRRAETESERETAYRRGTRGVLGDEYDSLAADRAALDDGLEPSLTAQIDHVESMSDDELAATIERVLGADEGRDELFALMPTAYDPGEPTASGTIVAVVQDTEGEYVAVDSAPASIVTGQQAIDEIGESELEGSASVFGNGMTADEIESAAPDSLAVVGPLAFAFVLVVLSIAYRDPIDVVVGLVGIVLVLVWTFGTMGWLGIDFALVFVPVPVLLIALSIDYAIHLLMRYREERTDGTLDADAGMAAGLAGVGVALVTVTLTTAVGFLSNVVGPIGPLREFGIVCAIGIVAALAVFGLFVPAVTVSIDNFLETRGIDRRRGALGTGDRLRPVLVIGKRIAHRAPLALLVVAVVLSAGGAYGGTQVDTSFDTAAFLPEEPEWTHELPDSVAPRTYTAAATIETLNEEFVRQDRRAQILVAGEITDSETLQRVDTAGREATTSETVARLPNDAPAIRSPVTAMESVAATNESFNETFHDADTDGDGVPDSRLAPLYDEFFAADSATAETVIHRTDEGEYEALRLIVTAAGDASSEAVTTETRAAATAVDGDGVTAAVTGQGTVLNYQTERAIVETIVTSLLATLAVVGCLLVVVSRRTAGSATLGLVTLIPVLLTLCWVLGTMWLLEIPFNYITGTIASLTIGLGIDYSVHVSERYHRELERGGTIGDALERTVTGTGGALLGSAATTAGGFGILGFAFLPSLQYFGLIAAISIGYALVASVIVLPTLLVYWTRFAAPDRDPSGPERASQPAATSTAEDD
ncbi:efflux RND transporter permease subunit [Natrinema longum]|uniref:MMPL family transporter n=1 Tax=Natrinema longum TaxID=370324 RepID=A0A8A2U846_9EURY|nr:MMPL family transporter [Natrinema longum]MBZ6493902.1 MMPL family transporter [Natrinema longum]QSW84763.1 MMPL family transporter [Natrinema longum]